MIYTFKRWLRAGLIAILLTLSLGLGSAFWSGSANASLLIASLPAGNAITDGRAILRYALPIDNKPVRQMQKALEDVAEQLRVSRRKLTAINGNLSIADRILNSKQAELLASVPSDRQPQAEALIAKLQSDLTEIRAAVDAQDRDAVLQKRVAFLDTVSQLEELMVTEFPFTVPEEYQNLPQLKGRATIAVKTSKGDLTVVVDGYSAPVTAGNFVDLVQRKFYDGLEFTRQEDSYVLQIGDPPGPEVGFIDPATKQYRAIPMEVLVEGETEPIYGTTLEAAGRYLDNPVLPFSSYGALAMARPGSDPNGGSSQFFFFLFEPELTPAGRNLLDGRYAVFGYVVEGKEVLEKLKAGDRIDSMTVVSGADKLVTP
ncbi:MAG TPA: peptidylprolyl isomerase [Chroococcidiopsis sp.]